MVAGATDAVLSGVMHTVLHHLMIIAELLGNVSAITCTYSC